ncbi:MAG: hypothetical protein H7A21_12855 [Spirochaetales bacterium]|nr:hypothetical protein [Leptospiraceae bacterium]MCP5482317.1 hypothetical protein [Spirochaetales bacterium]MCP5484244.1 hypothetical protein [Spirochaetales bacterium]
MTLSKHARRTLLYVSTFLALVLSGLLFAQEQDSLVQRLIEQGLSDEEIYNIINSPGRMEEIERRIGEIDSLRDEVSDEEYQFDVDVNPAFLRPIDQIGGQVIPDDFREQARRQNERAAPIAEEWAESAEPRFACDPEAAAFDWRKFDIITPIRDQGVCGSCWAFSAAASFEAHRALYNEDDSLDLSEQQFLDCVPVSEGCNGGMPGYVYDYLQPNFAAREAQLPYSGLQSQCRAGNLTPTRDYVLTYGYVEQSGGIPEIEDMKAALCRYGPLSAAVKITNLFTAYSGGVFDEHASYSEADVNHAIVIIGWDDERNAYLIKNSWGEKWGEDGYMWIDYESNGIGFAAAWVIATDRAAATE